MYDLGLADRLRNAGLRVVECDGWQNRGSDNFNPQGFVWHHTADGPNGRTPSLNGCIHGFSGSAPGPLCNVLQSREPDGEDIAYVVAAGRANHAGYGGWRGLSGNSSVWGLEIEHTGVEHFPEHREDVAWRIAAACLRGVDSRNADLACQHFEWSGYGDGSKIDVAEDVNADEWRVRTTEVLQGGGAPAPPEKKKVQQNMFIVLAAEPNGNKGKVLTELVTETGIIMKSVEEQAGPFLVGQSGIAWASGGLIPYVVFSPASDYLAPRAFGLPSLHDSLVNLGLFGQALPPPKP